ncbi:MAG: DNA-3-methyladenine glycosylase I [bacterium]|nr:DNA-3-methyladenine glycosylase I [bacterium]
MKAYTNKDLVDIFKATEKTFFSQSTLKKNELTNALEPFKQIKKAKRQDNDYFWVMVYVTFYSGFKATTVTDKIGAIQDFFGDLDKVAKYDETKVQKIIDSKKVIGHRQKINGIIHNAKQIKTIQKQFGSFDKYISSFGNTDEDTNFFALIKDLKKRFKYLGGITVFHFLTDIGFNVVKPDRVLCRIFQRLGLVDSEDDYAGVIKAGRQISLSTKLPIRYIDIIFVAYGQVGEKKEFGFADGICLSNNPKCEVCGIYSYCQFTKKKKIK